MGKAPAFQFYPGDWFREPGLKCVDLDVRGAWAELLMIMWDHNPQGQMETSLDGFAKLWRTNQEHAAHIISELEINKIADVEYSGDDSRKIIMDKSIAYVTLSPKCPDVSPKSPAFVTITNRRMWKAWKTREYERQKKSRQRAKQVSPASVPDVSPLHSSSSSSSSKKEKYKEKEKDPPKPHIEKIKIRDHISLTQAEINNLESKFKPEQLEWMYDKLNFYLDTTKKIYAGAYGFFKKGSWLLEEMEKHFAQPVTTKYIASAPEYEDWTGREPEFTAEEIRENKRKVAELAGKIGHST